VKRTVLVIALCVNVFASKPAQAWENEETFKTVGPYAGFALEHVGDVGLPGISIGLKFNRTDWFWGDAAIAIYTDKIVSLYGVCGTRLYSPHVPLRAAKKSYVAFQGGLLYLHDGYSDNSIGAVVKVGAGLIFTDKPQMAQTKRIWDVSLNAWLRQGTRINDGPEIGLSIEVSPRWVKQLTARARAQKNQTQTPSADSTTTVKGDINQDGRVDQADQTMFVEYLAKSDSLSPKHVARCDISEDGKLDRVDAYLFDCILYNMPILRGDINQDYKLDHEDVVLLYGHVKQIPGKELIDVVSLYLADVNQDHRIDEGDLKLLLKEIDSSNNKEQE